MALIRCPQCERILAALNCGMWAIQYQGREYIAEGVHKVRCDRCHLHWDVIETDGGDVVLVRPGKVA